MLDRIRSLWAAGNPTVEAAEARQLVQLVETLAKSPVEKVGNDFRSGVDLAKKFNLAGENFLAVVSKMMINFDYSRAA